MGSESSYPLSYDHTRREDTYLMNVDRNVFSTANERRNACYVYEPMVINNRTDLELAQQLFDIRKSDQCLVTALNYEIYSDNNLAKNTFNGRLQIERIPARLSQLTITNLPDTLHVYRQAIYGFQKLSKYFRYFLVTPECIGVNYDNIVKVWHHPNFTSVHPMQIVRSEHQMIMSMFDSIERHLGYQPFFPHVSQFSLFNGISTFENVKNKLIEYTRLYNQGNLPRRLNLSLEQYLNRVGYQTAITTIHKPLETVNSRSLQIGYSLQQPSYNLPHQQRFTSHINLNESVVSQIHRPISILQAQVATICAPQVNTQQIFSLPVHGTQRQQNRMMNNIRRRETSNNKQVQLINTQITRNHTPSKVINFSAMNHAVRTRQQFQNKSVDNGNDTIRSSQVIGMAGQHVRNKSNLKQKPTSMPIQSRPNRLNKSQSNFHPLQRQNSTQQRPKSQIKTLKSSQMKVSFVGNPGVNFTINDCNKLRKSNEHSISTLPTKDINISAIKQSAQGLKYKNVQQIGNQAAIKINQGPLINNRYFVKLPQVSVVGHSYQSSIVPVKTQNLNQTQQQNMKQSQEKDPWETIMRVVKSQPSQEQLHNQSTSKTIGQQSTIAERDKQKQRQENTPHTIVKPLKINSLKPISPQHPSHNESFSSIIGLPHGQPQILADMLRDTESINNSVRNFYSNFSGEDFSQIVDLSSPLDFRLSNKDRQSLFKLQEVSEINKMNMSSSKVFEQEPNKIQSGGTSLDLMQKLRITQTVHKDEHEESPKKHLEPSQFSQQLSIKHRSRSKQFNQDVAKLGFCLNSEQSNSQQSNQSKKNKTVNYEQAVNQWTPTYTDTYGNTASNKPKYNWENDYSGLNYISVPHQWKTREPQYEPKFEFKHETAYVTNLHNLDDRQYKFDWDPELLADMQSKAYTNSSYSG